MLNAPVRLVAGTRDGVVAYPPGQRLTVRRPTQDSGEVLSMLHYVLFNTYRIRIRPNIAAVGIMVGLYPITRCGCLY